MMEMFSLNSKVSAHSPTACVLWLKDKCKRTVCVLDTHTHSCFICHSALLLNLPVWAINSPTSFLAHYWECECVFGRIKGTEIHAENRNEREMCLQGFWHLMSNERRFCCFVEMSAAGLLWFIHGSASL